MSFADHRISKMLRLLHYLLFLLELEPEELELELEKSLTKERSYTVEIMTAPVALP